MDQADLAFTWGWNHLLLLVVFPFYMKHSPPGPAVSELGEILVGLVPAVPWEFKSAPQAKFSPTSATTHCSLQVHPLCANRQAGSRHNASLPNTFNTLTSTWQPKPEYGRKGTGIKLSARSMQQASTVPTTYQLKSWTPQGCAAQRSDALWSQLHKHNKQPNSPLNFPRLRSWLLSEASWFARVFWGRLLTQHSYMTKETLRERMTSIRKTVHFKSDHLIGEGKMRSISLFCCCPASTISCLPFSYSCPEFHHYYNKIIEVYSQKEPQEICWPSSLLPGRVNYT